jgi:hypothetical protein
MSELYIGAEMLHLKNGDSSLDSVAISVIFVRQYETIGSQQSVKKSHFEVVRLLVLVARKSNNGYF